MDTTPEVKEESKIKPKENHKNRGILIFLGILLIISIVMTVFGFDLYRVLFNSTQVKELLFNEVKNSNLVPAVLEYFSVERAKERVEKGEALSGVSEPDIPLLMSFMELEDWRDIKNNLLSDEFIMNVVAASVDGTYAWLDSTDVNPQIIWRMSQFKDALVGEPGRGSIKIGYEALPECTQKEIDDFTGRLAALPPGMEVLYNLCRFPMPWKDDQIDDYSHALINVNNNIPAEFVFSQMLKTKPGAEKLMPTVKLLLKTIRWIGKWGWLVTLLLIGLIVLLGLRPIKRLGKSLGLPFTVAGAILLVGNLLGLGSLHQWLAGLILSQTSDVVRREVAASLTHLSAQVFKPLLLQTLVVILVGISLLVLTAILKKKKTKENPQ